MRAATAVIGLLILLFVPPSAACAGPFSNWTAVVVAGDYHAHSGGPTEAFDNARRDVAKALVELGFERDSVRQFSVRPGRYPADAPGQADTRTLHEALRAGTQSAKAGCLFYISSHGGPEGAILGKEMLRPHLLAAILDDACPNRPSVVVISACFSGVFIPPLQKSDRLILTAARADRASFGCGESDKYPYFDACFLASVPDAHDFAALGARVQTCVARKENETGAEPASEPQVWIGAALRPLLPLYAFDRSASRTP
ncbi:peptidase C13 [Caulobacter segnis]|uniref:Peptidase C13, legumain asparaginyl peptidase n=2 Tax=Caulobacter segnis TaxID=88688 RepID=D5VFS6_CAUST|nr:C13 family peptidase [Caulobacter segnis]ADG09808.1 Peptidase C13, legumain asparaginyl peptidase [Caulobacter segnis ATCC 21756]AVQ01574.1 peptidase C13 [Caulobacter segnis]